MDKNKPTTQKKFNKLEQSLKEMIGWGEINGVKKFNQIKIRKINKQKGTVLPKSSQAVESSMTEKNGVDDESTIRGLEFNEEWISQIKQILKEELKSEQNNLPAFIKELNSLKREQDNMAANYKALSTGLTQRIQDNFSNLQNQLYIQNIKASEAELGQSQQTKECLKSIEESIKQTKDSFRVEIDQAKEYLRQEMACKIKESMENNLIDKITPPERFLAWFQQSCNQDKKIISEMRKHLGLETEEDSKKKQQQIDKLIQDLETLKCQQQEKLSISEINIRKDYKNEVKLMKNEIERSQKEINESLKKQIEQIEQSNVRFMASLGKKIEEEKEDRKKDKSQILQQIEERFLADKEKMKNEINTMIQGKISGVDSKWLNIETKVMDSLKEMQIIEGKKILEFEKEMIKIRNKMQDYEEKQSNFDSQLKILSEKQLTIELTKQTQNLHNNSHSALIHHSFSQSITNLNNIPSTSEISCDKHEIDDKINTINHNNVNNYNNSSFPSDILGLTQHQNFNSRSEDQNNQDKVSVKTTTSPNIDFNSRRRCVSQAVSPEKTASRRSFVELNLQKEKRKLCRTIMSFKRKSNKGFINSQLESTNYCDFLGFEELENNEDENEESYLQSCRSKTIFQKQSNNNPAIILPCYSNYPTKKINQLKYQTQQKLQSSSVMSSVTDEVFQEYIKPTFENDGIKQKLRNHNLQRSVNYTVQAHLRNNNSILKEQQLGQQQIQTRPQSEESSFIVPRELQRPSVGSQVLNQSHQLLFKPSSSLMRYHN